ncbi:MAG: hypothetical protein IT425_07270 [Pirellulales bacterium]|nr:hypothetical protein [Pirellulales bacterium]
MNAVCNSACKKPWKTEEPEEVIRRAQALVEAHMHFTGRAHAFDFSLDGDTLVVRGRVPSFYLKQVLQNALKNLEGVRCVDNRVAVLSAKGANYLDNGLS